MIRADVPQQAVSKHRLFLNRQGQAPQSAWDGAKVILDGDVAALMFPHSSLHLVPTSQHRIPSQSGSSCRDIRPARCTSSLHPSAQRVRIINIYCTVPPPAPAGTHPHPQTLFHMLLRYPPTRSYSPPQPPLTVSLLHLLGDSILC